LRNAMFQIFAVLLRSVLILQSLFQIGFGRLPVLESPSHLRAINPCIAIKQTAMSARIYQPTIIMLSVNLDQPATDITKQRSRTGLIVNKGTAAAIRLD